MPSPFRSVHESITRLASGLLTIAIVLPDRDSGSPHTLLLAGVMLYFAHNTCNALFGRAVSFPIIVRPEDADNYELARIYSAGYCIALWMMLAIAAS